MVTLNNCLLYAFLNITNNDFRVLKIKIIIAMKIPNKYSLPTEATATTYFM